MRELNVNLKQEKSDSPKPLLDRLQQLAQIFSLFALPLLVAIGGWYLQSSLASAQVSQRYVELAITTLREKPTKETEGLRRWAANTLAKYSATAFTPQEIKDLESGKTVLSETLTARATFPGGIKVWTTYDTGSGSAHIHLDPGLGGGMGTEVPIERGPTNKGK